MDAGRMSAGRTSAGSRGAGWRAVALGIGLGAVMAAAPATAFLEDVCLPRRGGGDVLTYCVRPTCPGPDLPNRACPAQLLDFATVEPGRSLIHMDSTYFLAQALGYRADVAYWIAAYDEVADYTQYVPIDQCGVQAANADAIAAGTTQQTVPNSGAAYISARFNGFQRTNLATDGPLDHYIVSFSPNGEGTDVHGAGGVQAIYPLYYPRPGYPEHIDDVYQKTLADLRQWAMMPSSEPGRLCTVGLTVETAGGVECLTGAMIEGAVPILQPAIAGIPLNVPAGPKVLDSTTTDDGTVTYYDQLAAWLEDPARTSGSLWLDAEPGPVPVQLARLGLYLHALQDSASHATYCGDDAPSPPGGGDSGTYMYLDADGDVQVSYGDSCATGPHLASHVQETGTGAEALPLRVYTALDITLDELIAFGNRVALHQPGWIVNPELLPPDVVGGENGQGMSADELSAELVGEIVSGVPYTRGEKYVSGIVTLPLQEVDAVDRLQAMNRALGEYGATLAARASRPGSLVPLVPMPGNSFDPNDRSVCWVPDGGS